MSFAELVTADRRLEILRLLEQDPGYSHNDRVIQTGLRLLGHTVSLDVVRTDFAWLEEQGLVKSEQLDANVTVATLTSRGADVARGSATCPGVKRPDPV